MQSILPKIHQYRVQIYISLGKKIFIADWLSRHNHEEGKDKTIKDMDIRIDAIQSMTDILECVSISQTQQASAQGQTSTMFKMLFNCRLAEHEGRTAQCLKAVVVL